MSTFSPLIPPSGRETLDVLGLHCLPASNFKGKVVYDLGCGGSDLGAGLGALGIRAAVTGFDNNPNNIPYKERSEYSGKRVTCDIANVEADDASADIVLATYSLPMWARSAGEIDAFFNECKRLVRIGGLLSIYPIAVTIQQFEDSLEGDIERSNRVLTARLNAHDIDLSRDWLNLSDDNERLTARKLR